MKENKKDIERLFQEKFKDFEATPPLESWANIEERLNQKKKKRRVIPFWFKTSGIAATLILGVFLFMNKKDNLNTNVNEVVIENNIITNVIIVNNLCFIASLGMFILLFPVFSIIIYHIGFIFKIKYIFLFFII